MSGPVDDENYATTVDVGFTYSATDALPSLGVELSMAHAQEAGLAGQIAPPAAVPLPRERAAKTTGLLGGARGDRNHDLMLVGVRVRKLVRSRVPGPRLVVTEYLVVGVDMVQQHAYDVEDLQGASLKTDLPRRLMRAPDELLERQGEWQPLPHQSSIVPLRPTAFFCATCMLQSSHKPCVLCSGSDGTPEHMLLNVQQFDSRADAQSGTSRGTEAVQSSLDPEQSSATVPTSSQELVAACELETAVQSSLEDVYGVTELNSTLRLSVETERAASLSRAIERELQAAEESSELLLHEAPGPATAAFLAQSRTVAREEQAVVLPSSSMDTSMSMAMRPRPILSSERTPILWGPRRALHRIQA